MRTNEADASTLAKSAQHKTRVTMGHTMPGAVSASASSSQHGSAMRSSICAANWLLHYSAAVSLQSCELFRRPSSRISIHETLSLARCELPANEARPLGHRWHTCAGPAKVSSSAPRGMPTSAASSYSACALANALVASCAVVKSSSCSAPTQLRLSSPC